jgi:hypothetical protein
VVTDFSKKHCVFNYKGKKLGARYYDPLKGPEPLTTTSCLMTIDKIFIYTTKIGT